MESAEFFVTERNESEEVEKPEINLGSQELPGYKSVEETFYDSVRDNNIENIKLLIENRSVNVNTTFEGQFVSLEYRSWTGLHVACKKDLHTLLGFLLHVGADPTIADKKGETPLHIACKHGHNKCVEILLAHDPRLKDFQNQQGLTPLCKALYRLETPFKEKEYYKTVDLLIQAGCDVNLSPVTNMTPLHLVAQKWCNSKVIEKLIKAGADVNAETVDSSALMSALCRHRVDTATVMDLIDAGANVNYKNPSGKSVLHVAVAKSEDICVRHLLEAGANPNAVDADGSSPLLIAVCENNITITPLLLKFGGNVNFKSRENNMSLLCQAVWNGNKKIARLLLSHNADVDAMTSLSESSLNYAVLNSDIDMAKLLLRRNCILDNYLLVPDIWDYETAISVAIGNADEKMIKLLLRGGFPCGKVPVYDLKTDLKDHPKLMDWILQFIRTPKSLVDLCRFHIRKVYRQDVFRVVEKLVQDNCIPSRLAGTILLEDILDE